MVTKAFPIFCNQKFNKFHQKSHLLPTKLCRKSSELFFPDSIYLFRWCLRLINVEARVQHFHRKILTKFSRNILIARTVRKIVEWEWEYRVENLQTNITGTFYHTYLMLVLIPTIHNDCLQLLLLLLTHSPLCICSNCLFSSPFATLSETLGMKCYVKCYLLGIKKKTVKWIQCWRKCWWLENWLET